ncbi:MBL fold metallo-hydrolase [Diplocloster hominis]|uniref:MBL fold metallo-hydrolase n=1 Tax=Diplocloster hominis TaxID=3079010 RepID=UPI0031BAF41E
MINDFTFLSHEKLRDRLYLIRECYLNPENIFNIYIVLGDHKTGIFDTGLGVTSGLRSYIEQNITASHNPMCAYMTHVDLDHSGGAMLFDEAYMNERELPKLAWNLNVKRRLSDLSVFCKNNPDVLKYCEEHYLHNEDITFQNIDDGEIIDLGGVKLEVIKLPGHTPGSLVYYNRAEDYVLGGDAIQLHNTCQRCRDLKESVFYYERFIERMPEEVTIYTGHERYPLTLAAARDIQTGMREILTGLTAKDTPSGMPFPCIDPEELSYDVKEHRCGQVSVVYDANILKIK